MRLHPGNLATPAFGAKKETRQVASGPFSTRPGKDTVHIRFGQAAGKDSAPPPARDDDAETPKPGKFLTRDASKHLQFLERQVFPQPVDESWPVGLLMTLTMDPAVDAYLEREGISSYDILHGVNNLLLPKLKGLSPERPDKKMARKQFEDMIKDLSRFCQERALEKLTPIDLWHWLIADNPSGTIEDLLIEAGITPDMVERLKNSPPEREVVVEQKEPSREEVLKTRDIVRELPNRIIGQDEAVGKLAQAYRRGRLGYVIDNGKPDKPKNRLLLLGPSGVGKTYSAQVLAKMAERPVIYLPLNQFKNGEQSVAMLTGAAPGYKGYGDGGSFADQIIKANEATRTQGAPPPIVILDEIEKADPAVFDVLMQALDMGLIRNGNGQYGSFKEMDVIINSNIAQKEIIAAHESGMSETEIEELVHKELEKHFRPEFIGRIQEVITYKSLTPEEVRKILDLQLVKYNEAVQHESGFSIDVAEALKTHLTHEGYSAKYGVRYLENALDRILQPALIDFREEKILEDLEPEKLRLSFLDGKVVSEPVLRKPSPEAIP